eukprot:m.424529 g.424529  ORF g.424529 m.424529 type:complete len:115 (-) comp47319_c0_seq1:138-482(-)
MECVASMWHQKDTTLAAHNDDSQRERRQWSGYVIGVEITREESAPARVCTVISCDVNKGKQGEKEMMCMQSTSTAAPRCSAHRHASVHIHSCVTDTQHTACPMRAFMQQGGGKC